MDGLSSGPMTRLRTTLLRSALAVAVLQCVASVVLAHTPPTLGEPLALRWLRTAEDHPVRSPAALLCLLLALRPRRVAQDPGREGGAGAVDPLS